MCRQGAPSLTGPWASVPTGCIGANPCRKITLGIRPALKSVAATGMKVPAWGLLVSKRTQTDPARRRAICLGTKRNVNQKL